MLDKDGVPVEEEDEESDNPQVMPTKDTKLMLKDILNMCVTTSSIKVGWMEGD